MSNKKTRIDLDRVQELYDFLQGTLPEGYEVTTRKIPNLTPDRAWTVVWYLGNLNWEVPDYIERCDDCGELFNSESEGSFREKGPPHHLCGSCECHHPEPEEAT